MSTATLENVTVCDHALRYLRNGVSVIPIRTDGSKGPTMDWAGYTKSRMPEEDVDLIFDEHTGIAAICGAVSGNLGDLDFDDPRLFEPWKAAVIAELGQEFFDRLVIIQTPRPGRAVIYRSTEPVKGNMKLAQREPTPEELAAKPDQKLYTLIETRGERGYFITPGSPLATHKNGTPYEFLQGSFDGIPIITSEQEAVLLAAAATFDRIERADYERQATTQEPDSDPFPLRPGDDFNQRGPSIEEMLVEEGWRVDKWLTDGRVWLTRPGKEDGTSGSISSDGRYFWVFSTSTGFKEYTSYSKWGVYTELNHGGDFQASAQALWDQGYGSVLVRPPLNDSGNAERIVIVNGSTMRYCHELKKWLLWNGQRWIVDRHGQAVTLAQTAMRHFARQAGRRLEELATPITDEEKARVKQAKRAVGFAHSSLNKPMLDRMLAVTESLLPISAESLDTHYFKIYFKNGVLDVRTGKFGPADPKDYSTKMIRHHYNPKADCPRFKKFLEEIQPDDPEVRAYLQRALGYSLTGDTSEKAVFFCYGAGGNNGKTTLLEIVGQILEEYAITIRAESLVAFKFESSNASADLADLRGVRFARSSEISRGQRFDEGKLKGFVQGGNSKIKATRKYENPFEFRETHKFWFDTNQKPGLDGLDPAIWSRVHLIPFEVTIPPEKRDRNLKQALLRTEAEGILAWLVQGALDWYRQGLNPPSSVISAGAEWQEDSDPIGQFLSSRCDVSNPDVEIDFRVLYEAYHEWCFVSGFDPWKQKTFGKALTERKGFNKRESNSKTLYRGLALRSESQ